MKSALFVTLSALDNDNRILKSMQTLREGGWSVEALSVNSTKGFDFLNHNVIHGARRYFGIPGFGWVVLYWRVFQALKGLNLSQYDVIHCNDLNTLPIGAVIKRFYHQNVRLVYDAHEYEINAQPGQRRWSIWLHYRLEKWLIPHADRVITVSDSIADEYVKLYGIQKPALVLNTPHYQRVEKGDRFRERFDLSKDATIFLYQGALSRGRGVEALLNVFKTLPSDQVIVFMGYGVLAPLVHSCAETYENIFLHEAVAPEVLITYSSSADVGIAMIENSCLSYYYCLPNKLFEYMMAGIPVIVSDLPEMRHIVETHGVGVIAEGDDEDALKHALEAAMQWDRRGLEDRIETVKHTYNWEMQETVLLNVYKEVMHVRD